MMSTMNPSGRWSVYSMAVACLLALAVWVVPTHAQEAPFTGVIVEDNTLVRSGGGNPFYAVARLPKGATVTVEEVVFGWYRIAPPPGSASVIEKSLVQLAADGKTATVTADNAPVFAASIETESAGPDKHWRRQLNIERGKSVQVLGEEGKFYRITPPAGASVYVAPTALRRVDASVAAMSVAPPTPPAPVAPATTPVTSPLVAPAAIPVPAPTTATPPATSTPATTTPPAASTATPTTPVAPSTPAPASAPVVTPAPTTTNPSESLLPPVETVTSTPASTPAPTAPAPSAPLVLEPITPPAPVAPPVVVRRSTAAFVELEQRFREAMKLPLEEQPLGELQVAYRSLQTDAQLLPSEARIIPARLLQLDRNQKLTEQLGDLSSLKNELGLRQERIESVRIESVRRTNAPQEGVPGQGKYYDAVGQLVGSAVYDGNRMPQLFRLLDASSLRTVAYVQPGDKVNPKVYLGQVVGLIGSSRYDPSLKLNIFEVKSVDILQPSPNN